MLFLYRKSGKDDLTAAEKKVLRRLVEEWLTRSLHKFSVEMGEYAVYIGFSRYFPSFLDLTKSEVQE
jgi:hypothetical protein